MKFHEDDRAQRLIDVFPVLPGQINISYVNSTEHVVAWHRHELQTDYFCCVKGSFKIGLCDGNTARFEYISDKNPTNIIQIDPTIWHGYRALEPGSIILYYVNRKWTPADETKMLPGAFGEDWGTISK